MTFWIFNWFMWYLLGQYPQDLQAWLAAGNSFETCVELTPSGLIPSNACVQPAPETPGPHRGK